MLHDEWLDEARAEEIAHKVREELARRRISRQALADMARISISTLEKALSGRRCLHPGDGDPARGGARHVAARSAPAAVGASDSAPDELGGYSHAGGALARGPLSDLASAVRRRSPASTPT